MTIRCIAFDFDGTLVQSNRIKRSCFYETVSDVPGGAAVLDDLHDEGFSGDRYDVFRELCHRLDLAGEDRAMDLAQRYGDLCRKGVLECDEVPGAARTLDELKQSDLSLYIVSATPQADLVPIVSGRGLTPYFKAVLGRPVTKAEHLRAIMEQEQLRPRSLVMVGDGVDDQVAAIAADCHFIAVTDDPMVPLDGNHASIRDLRQLKPALAEVEAPVGGQVRFAQRHNIP